jgi:hydrogenase maturation protease
MKTTTALSQILIVGYGNTLRSDDGVGYQVAENVAAWQIPQVRSISKHQLLPELAPIIADTDIVIFIDAIVAIDRPTRNIHITPLDPDPDTTFSTHLLTPQLLLSLTQRLYHKNPEAYLITIPAINFSLGMTLSPIADQGKNLALDYLKSVLRYTGSR